MSDQRQRRSFVRALLAAATASSVAAGAQASPSARFGFGSRSQALAGADVADARGAPGVFENPAALVQSTDTELTLGTSFTNYDFTVDGAPSDVYVVSDDADAKQQFFTLVAGSCFRYLDAGRLKNARIVERMTLFSGELGQRYGYFPRMNWRLLGEPWTSGQADRLGPLTASVRAA